MGKVKVCSFCGKLKGKISFGTAHCTCKILELNVDLEKGYCNATIKLSEPIKKLILKDVKL